MVAAGQILEGLFEALRGLAQALAIGSSPTNLMISRTWQAILRASSSLVSVSRISSVGLVTADSFFVATIIFELFFAVSSTRTRSSLALGKDCKRRKNFNAQILGCGHPFAKCGDVFIERFVIESSSTWRWTKASRSRDSRSCPWPGQRLRQADLQECLWPWP